MTTEKSWRPRPVISCWSGIEGEHSCWWRGGVLLMAWNTCTLSTDRGNVNNLCQPFPWLYLVSVRMQLYQTWNPRRGMRNSKWRSLLRQWWLHSVHSPEWTSSGLGSVTVNKHLRQLWWYIYQYMYSATFYTWKETVYELKLSAVKLFECYEVICFDILMNKWYNVNTVVYHIFSPLISITLYYCGTRLSTNDSSVQK